MIYENFIFSLDLVPVATRSYSTRQLRTALKGKHEFLAYMWVYLLWNDLIDPVTATWQVGSVGTCMRNNISGWVVEQHAKELTGHSKVNNYDSIVRAERASTPRSYTPVAPIRVVCYRIATHALWSAYNDIICINSNRGARPKPTSSALMKPQRPISERDVCKYQPNP